jgi:S-DNA-T family DNA segregation ATPase FtsK/SpoIIIE
MWPDMTPEPEAEDEPEDELLDEAIALARREKRASISFLQRRLRIGYVRAARLIDQMEEQGVVGPMRGAGRPRKVLETEEEMTWSTM